MKRTLNFIGWFLLCLGGFVMGLGTDQGTDPVTRGCLFFVGLCTAFAGFMILRGGEEK